VVEEGRVLGPRLQEVAQHLLGLLAHAALEVKLDLLELLGQALGHLDGGRGGGAWTGGVTSATRATAGGAL
jgi:hypothetical protein